MECLPSKSILNSTISQNIHHCYPSCILCQEKNYIYNIYMSLTGLLPQLFTLHQSVSQFSCSAMAESLWPHGLQHIRPLCPSQTPWAFTHPCPLSWWCQATILLLCHPLLLPSIFPSIRVFSDESALCIRWPKYWSFSFSISPSNDYSGWFPSGLTDLISFQSKRLLRVFSNTTVQKHYLFCAQPST